MRLLVDNRVARYRLRPRLLDAAAQTMGRKLKLEPRAVVSLVLCSARALARLGGRHFGRPYVTDVIAFPTGIDEVAGGMLGEIWISPETVERNGERYGKGLNGEFLFVLAHGLLHLLGHDDATESERREMFERQEALLKALGKELPGVIARAR